MRRRWPRTLLAWSRVLAGRFRDPLVGRELLAGTLLANAAFGSLIVGRIIVEWMGQPSPRLLELSLGSADRLLDPVTGRPQRGGPVVVRRKQEADLALRRFGSVPKLIKIDEP